MTTFEPGEIICRRIQHNYPQCRYDMFVEYVRKIKKRNPDDNTVHETSYIISPAGSGKKLIVDDRVLRKLTPAEEEDYVLAKLQDRDGMKIKVA